LRHQRHNPQHDSLQQSESWLNANGFRLASPALANLRAKEEIAFIAIATEMIFNCDPEGNKGT
jgi:hypothetical protein